jgi:hypothetical protein
MDKNNLPPSSEYVVAFNINRKDLKVTGDIRKALVDRKPKDDSKLPDLDLVCLK